MCLPAVLRAQPAPCAACLHVSILPGQALFAPAVLNRATILLRVAPGAARKEWDTAFRALRERGARAGFHVTGIPAEEDAALAAGDVLAIDVAHLGAEDAFALKRALVRARGERPGAQIILLAAPDVAEAIAAQGLEPYADAVLPPARSLDDLRAALVDPHHRSSATVRLLPDDVVTATRDLRAIAALQAYFPAGLASVPDRAVRCAGRPLPTFLNPATLDLVAYGACSSSSDVVSDTPGAPVEVAAMDGWTAIKVTAGTGNRFAEGISVAGARALRVEEIIARHQAYAARQAARVDTRISTGTLTLTFEAPGFPAPVTITSRTIMFVSRDRTDLRQQDITVNGVAFSGHGGVPRLPIIEPERAAAPPLAITLTNVYRYKLEGRERLRGRDCYVVGFEPGSGRLKDRPPERGSLYSGRAWIDAATFAMVRVSAVQTGLRGPITASEQTDDFAPGPADIWLLARSDVRQTYEGASVRTPIHRLLVIDANTVNPPDFVTRRDAAYASNDVMLRDTPSGYRYLTRTAAAAPGATAAPTRVVAGRASRVRTFAFGAIVDPNISRPLPFAGLSYVDFDLLGTGAQFNGFFGGTFGQLAVSLPSLRGTRWQLAGRAFGIVSSYNDRAFVRGREVYAEDIRQRPASAAVWLLRPLSPRVSLRLEYDWDYTMFGRTDVTDPRFLVPANQVVHGARLGLDLQRAGWQGSVWWNPARRAGWRAWGDHTSPIRSFQRYGASALRSVAVSPRVATRIEAAWMAGHDLDRFSRYSFGAFDNRLHGYPSALVRYDRGAVLRTAIAWTATKGVRLDGFADTARVHDPGFGRGLRPYTGVGAAAEVPAPFGTLLALEWGFGMQGLDAHGHRGTHVVRISGYKVF